MFTSSFVVLESGALVIGADGGLVEVAEKGVGSLFAFGALRVVAEEVVGDGGGDGCVFEDVVDDGAPVDPRGDEDCRDADAEAIEVEGVGGAGGGRLRDEGPSGVQAGGGTWS